MFNLVKLALVATFAFVACHGSPASAHLTAGTGKAKIDPAASLFPVDNGAGDAPFNGVHDSLFARALVLEQNGVRTVIVVTDTVNLPDDVYGRLVVRIADRYRVAKDRIWLTATHVHTVPWSLGKGYEQTVSDGVFAAIGEAVKTPEAVTVGSGAGMAFLNVNRDERTAKGFILGQDPTGPSDKTVRVVGFFRANNTPKAILANYAVHAVVLHSSVTGVGRNSLISADLPGATDGFVDAHYAGAMTFWTSGAAGDQNPIMMSYYAEPGADGMPVITDLKATGFALVGRWGQNLGLEIVRVVDAMRPKPVTEPIRAAQTILRCPVKAAGGAPKPLRISWLGIGSIDLVGVSGEVGTVIDHRLRERTGRREPILMTLTNGYAGYLPDDASYMRGNTFEVDHSFFLPHCAESGIIDAAVRLLEL